MERKLLFFDIDGTLADEWTSEIPESALAALKQAKANGHLLFVNTGRTRATIYDRIFELGLDGILGGCGSRLEMDGKVVFSHELSHEESVAVLKAMRALNIEGFYEGDTHMFFEPVKADSDPGFVRYRSMFTSKPFFRTVDENDPDFHFVKCFLFLRPDTDREAFRRALEDRFSIIMRAENAAELPMKAYTKATGIDEVCRIFGASLDDCYAFGDSMNDLSMLLHVPHGIAMGNSPEALKRQVSYVTDDLHEDGLANAMKHFGLI